MQIVFSISYAVIFGFISVLKEIGNLVTDILARAYPEVTPKDYLGYAAAIEDSSVRLYQNIKKYFAKNSEGPERQL